jgi:hypothetical protein
MGILRCKMNRNKAQAFFLCLKSVKIGIIIII